MISQIGNCLHWLATHITEEILSTRPAINPQINHQIAKINLLPVSHLRAEHKGHTAAIIANRKQRILRLVGLRGGIAIANHLKSRAQGQHRGYRRSRIEPARQAGRVR
ncbi:MAG: hypothetical protein EBS83_15375 [Planctomycetia bacterium]|nr:hypothetical protein [Planctomycetia bacterium]